VVGSTGSHQFRTVAPTTFKPYPDTIVEGLFQWCVGSKRWATIAEQGACFCWNQPIYSYCISWLMVSLD